MTRPAVTRPAPTAVLWDADGVLQHTPAGVWDEAVRVVEQFPGALTGAPLDEARIRTAAAGLGLGDRVEEILTVWSTFDLLAPSFDVVAATRAGGTACHLASNQDTLRARLMREQAAYAASFDRLYFSCDLGVAKPSTAFFDHVVADLGVEPGALLFLDDKPANVEGARSAGLVAETWSHLDGTAALRTLLRDHGVAIGDGARPGP